MDIEIILAMLQEYIMQDALILVPVLLFVGYMLKSTPKINDWTIPYFLMPLGVVFSNAMMGLSVDSTIQGILVAGAAVLMHQLKKQIQSSK